MQRIPIWKFVLILIVIIPLAIGFSINAFREGEQKAEFLMVAILSWLLILYVVHNQFWGYRKSFATRTLLWSAMITGTGLFLTLGGLIQREFLVLPIFFTIAGLAGVILSIQIRREKKRRKHNDRSE